MRIMIVSDCHGCVDILDNLRERISLEKPDLLIFCGDIVKGHVRGNEWLSAKEENRQPRRDLKSLADEESEDTFYYREFFRFLESLGFPCCIVPGNMDAPWSRFWNAFSAMPFRNIHLVHRTFFFVGKIMIYGFGGEISDTEKEDFFVLIYPRWEVERAFTSVEAEQRIYVFHHPPEGFSEGGSKILRMVVDRDNPMLVACGHKHKDIKVEKIGESTVMNPGPLKEKRYAIYDSDTGEATLNLID